MEKVLNFSPFPPENLPLSRQDKLKFALKVWNFSKKHNVLTENLPVGFAWEFACEGYPLKEQKLGEMSGGCVGTGSAKDALKEGKSWGSCRREEWAEKVAKIDFLEVGNHAKNGHLSKDKVTKCSDKVFVLKKTST